MLTSATDNEAQSIPKIGIPNYELVRELHRGGQGTVYLAIQQSTDRPVAVKVFRHRPGGLDEVGRFEREVEVLSRLKHPNVVTIHDCGRVESDVYLVMDYVAGRPLDVYLTQEEPGLRDTLGLFAKICDGVNAAHLRGVIHRDLKPSNIRIDEQGEPRILDFGLAKFQDGQDRTADGMTQTGQFIGSLPWASPEQAEARSDSMDIRSDVYSLGVLFYQLLTGSFPYPVSGRQDEVVRHIASTDPARPSTFDRTIVHDVETILLKCLAKEPERRYQNAGEVARDLRHFLAGEPIEAKRDSLRYVLGKQLRRHRAIVALVLLLSLLVTGGLTASLTQWYRAEQALIEKEQQRKLAEQRANQIQRVAEFQSKMLSDIRVEQMGRGIKERFREQVKATLERHHVGDFPNRRARTPEEVNSELGTFDRMTGSAPGIDIARQVMDDYVLKHAVEALVQQFNDQPLVLAQLQASIGGVYRSLGILDRSEAIWRQTVDIRRRELGPDHSLIADALNELAMVLQDMGRFADAEPIYRESLAMRRRLYGDEHVDVAKSMSNLGELLRVKGDYVEAEPLVRDALAMQRKLLGDAHVEVSAALNNVGTMLHSQGKLADAEKAYRESLEIRRQEYGDEDPEVVGLMSNLGVLLNDRGRFAEAELLNREVLELQQKIHGYEHREVGRALNALAYSLHQQGKFADAEPIYREALELRRRLDGDVNPDVGRALNNLAVVLKDMGKYDDAEVIQREALDVRIKALGENHADVARTINNLAALLKAKGDLDGAEYYYRDALERRRKAIGKDEHPDVAKGIANLAVCLSEKGKHSEAEALSRQALVIRRKVYGDEHAEIATNLNNLASEVAEQGREQEALQLRQEALAMYKKLLGNDHPNVGMTLHNLAGMAKRRGDYEEAESTYREALRIFRARYDGDHPEIATTQEQLAALLIDANRLEEAEPLITEALAMSSRKFPGDHPYKAVALSTMALFYFQKAELAEAKKTISEAADMILRIRSAEHKDSKSILERRERIFAD